LDPVKYQQIRGADQLARVLEGIALLKDFPHPKFLTCIVSDVNRAEVPVVVRFAREQGFLPVMGAYHWNVGTYGRPDELLMYDRSSAAAVFSGLLDDDLIPPGYLRKFVEDNVSWLRGQKLEPCDAERYSIAIDASGNVSPCLAFPSVGNLLESSLNEILGRFNREAIIICSDNSSCNRLDGRVVGTILRHPIVALRTARSSFSSSWPAVQAGRERSSRPIPLPRIGFLTRPGTGSFRFTFAMDKWTIQAYRPMARSMAM